MLPKSEFIPTSMGSWPSLGQPNDIPPHPVMMIILHHVRFHSIDSEGWKRNRLLLTKGDVEVEGSEEEKVHFLYPNTPNVLKPPHTSPKSIHSYIQKVSRLKVERTNKATNRWLRGGSPRNKRKTLWNSSYDEKEEAWRSLTEVRPRLGNPPAPSVHRLSKEKSPWLTVRGDVWGTAAVAVGRLGSFDVQVQ